MNLFSEPVGNHMHPAVYTVSISASLETTAMEMAARGASGLVVVDDDARPVGVVSLTDLLARGGPTHAVGSHRASSRLTVRELFTADPVCIEPQRSLREAAQLMIEREVHRLMVVEDVEPVGVLSVTDLLRPVADSDLGTPIVQLAGDTIGQVGPKETLGRATQLLQAAGVRGLVVMDAGWPVGAFGQREALESRDAGEDVLVEHWMSPAVVCLPQETPLNRAAAQAIAMHTPLIVTLEGRKPKGVLTPTDLLRAIR